ncbi:MAG TPA: DUF5668 domain-containing protein [Terriglobales bacterium]|nr:DUF5668 domain-containing protein [Terriglobales bacterium]
MNCANHTDMSAVAFCRTCGKPLCANCTRDVRGVIYCENCLAARLEGTTPPAPAYVPPTTSAPAAGFAPVNTGRPTTPPVTPYSASGPNPAVAGILAGFFPFGVGAVYTSQYAKGLAHLIIFTLLVWGESAVNTSGLHTLLGLGIAFFYVYQIIDSVRSAHALQRGQTPPDPFGLAQAFGGGERVDTSKVPVGAVILIALGALFLLHTLGWAEFGLERYWPLILIGLGIWLFLRRWGLVGDYRPDCDRCRTRNLMGPAMLLTFGIIFELQAVGVADLDRTWPIILLVVGVVKLVQSNASTIGHVDYVPPSPGTTGGSMPPANPPQSPVEPASGEVRNV